MVYIIILDICKVEVYTKLLSLASFNSQRKETGSCLKNFQVK